MNRPHRHWRPTGIGEWHQPGDGVTILTLYVVLLMASPSQYVVGPLGAAGTPAQILAMMMTVWWAGGRLARPFIASSDRQPIRTAMLLFVTAALVSYVVANLRPLTAMEGRAADRGLLSLLAWSGLILVAGDQILSRSRLDVLLRRLVLAVAAVAALGLFQFVTGVAVTNHLKLPGLIINNDLYGVATREGFARPASTAVSPIEFGVVVTMMLPVTLHYAINDRHLGPVRRWLPVALVGLAIPISVSRSAIICAVVGVALMLPVMNRQMRWLTGFGALGLAGLIYIAVPGMLGALLSLFTGIGEDTSAASRTGSYAIAGEFIDRSPWFGRGFGTFLPQYRILDNQLLGTTIDMGLVGLLALLGLFGTGLVLARRVVRRSADPATRRLSQALFASLAAGSASFAFFDAFSFPMVAGLTFLVLGAIAALHRLHTAASRTSVTDRTRSAV